MICVMDNLIPYLITRSLVIHFRFGPEGRITNVSDCRKLKYVHFLTRSHVAVWFEHLLLICLSMHGEDYWQPQNGVLMGVCLLCSSLVRCNSKLNGINPQYKSFPFKHNNNNNNKKLFFLLESEKKKDCGLDEFVTKVLIPTCNKTQTGFLI